MKKSVVSVLEESLVGKRIKYKSFVGLKEGTVLKLYCDKIDDSCLWIVVSNGNKTDDFYSVDLNTQIEFID